MSDKQILFACVIYFLSGFLLGVVVAEESHDLKDPNHWYDFECCNERDCRPAKPGEVKAVEGGYYIPKMDRTIPFTSPALRRSKDFQTHICTTVWCDGGDPGDDKAHCVEQVRCLYIAGGI